MEDVLLVPTNPSLLETGKYRKLLFTILTYPKTHYELARERLEILRSVGVDAFLLDGDVNVDGVPVLGKGTNSIVVKAYYRERLVVVKILRLDASRDSLENEAKILEYIKDRDIAPEPILYKDWFLIQEFIQGTLLGSFINEDIYVYSKWEIESFLETLFKKAYTLDKLGVDHGELTRPNKHVIVLDNLDSRIIDFESASLRRTPKNLTSLYQYIFIRSPASNYLRSIFGIKNMDEIIDILSRYKKNCNEDTFVEVLNTFRESKLTPSKI